jgi:hypothetical protein
MDKAEDRLNWDLYDANRDWVLKNGSEIKEKYGGMDIAVLNQRVIAASDNTDEFLSLLSGLTEQEMACVYTTKVNHLNVLMII